MEHRWRIGLGLLLGLLVPAINLIAENAEITYKIWHGYRGGEQGHPMNIFLFEDSVDVYFQKDTFKMEYEETPIFPRTDLSVYKLSSGYNGTAGAAIINYTPTEEFPLFYLYFAQEEYTGFTSHVYEFVSIDVLDQNENRIGCHYYNEGTEKGVKDNFVCKQRDGTNMYDCYRPWDIMAFDLTRYIGQTITIRAICTCCSNIKCWNRLYMSFEKARCVDICSTCPQTPLVAPTFSHPQWHKGSVNGPVVSTASTYEVPAGENSNYFCTLVNDTCEQSLLMGRALYIYPQFTGQVSCSMGNREVTITNSSYMSYSASSETKIECDTAYWDFGDGRTSTDIHLSSIAYHKDGQYWIKLITGSKGMRCFATDSILVSIGVQHYLDSIASVCISDIPFVWRGKLYNHSGNFADTVVASTGCDSVLHLQLTVLDTTSSVSTYSICEGTTIRWNGKRYSQQGWYSDTIPNAAGCDSILHLHIIYKDCGQPDDSIVPLNPQRLVPIRDTIDTTLCEGTRYKFRNKIYSITGLYRDTARTALGWDSIIWVINVEVVCCDTSYSYMSKQILESELPYSWNDCLITSVPLNESRDTALVYRTQNAQACDSIARLHLHVLDRCEHPTNIIHDKWKE